MTIVAAIHVETFSGALAGRCHPSRYESKRPALESAVQLGQIRSVDRERLVKRLGTLEPLLMRQVAEAIKVSLGLVAL